MREIKFRAWHIADKTMLPWQVIKQSAYNTGSTSFLYDILVRDKHLYHVMQYAGINTITGREFFEGDIVKSSLDNKIYAITWSFTEFRLSRKISENGTAWQTLMPADEILGNIYLTPEN